jgi:murein DD-endopeptidase MepM/ murein hydrolase activator NlpD
MAHLKRTIFPGSARAHPALAATMGLTIAVVAAGMFMAAGILGRRADSAGEAPPAASEPTQPAVLPPTTRLLLPALVRQGKPLAIVASSGAIYQGGTTLVTVPGAVSGTAEIFGRSYPLAPLADGVAGFVAAGVLDPPGETTLVVVATDASGKSETLDRPLMVLATPWTVDYITLPPGVGGGLTAEVVQAEEDLLAAMYGGVTDRRWGGPWQAPVDAPVTGYFGEQRSFNGGPVSGHHGGTDFGVEEGTPVTAANAGTVVLAQELAVRGNMVIIDHGAGVFSGYSHLHEIKVIAGEPVTTGQVIGLVGTTGLSTGPHLHWEQAVRGILVDGLRWVDGSQGF